MANTFMTNVPDAFTLGYLGQELTKAFQQKGYIVTTALSGTDNLRVRLEKNCGGINLLMGLGKGITASCSLQNNTLVVNYLEGDWIGKIIGLAVGWILCFIPFITAIIGCIQQVGLPNEINMESQLPPAVFNLQPFLTKNNTQGGANTMKKSILCFY